MKTRTLYELYTILLKEVEKSLEGGICINASCLRIREDISNKEYTKLIDNFKSKGELAIKKFEAYPLMVAIGGFWWHENERRIRIKFIKYIISQLNDKRTKKGTKEV